MLINVNKTTKVLRFAQIEAERAERLKLEHAIKTGSLPDDAKANFSAAAALFSAAGGGMGSALPGAVLPPPGAVPPPPPPPPGCPGAPPPPPPPGGGPPPLGSGPGAGERK